MGKEQFKEHLMKFDLTRQEAAVYESLLENGKLTGYEAAKLTGFPVRMSMWRLRPCVKRERPIWRRVRMESVIFLCRYRSFARTRLTS